MTVKNQEYEAMWERLEARQRDRRKSAGCEQALRVVETHRQAEWRQRAEDPMTMWHVAEKSGPIKLHDAETGLTTIPEQKPEPEGLTVWQMVGAFLAMGVTALVAIGMALVL